MAGRCCLRNVNGVFIDIWTLEVEDTGISDSSGDGCGGSEGEEPNQVSPGSSGPSTAEKFKDIRAQNTDFLASNTELRAQVSSLEERVSRVRNLLNKETGHLEETWQMNCAQVSGFDEAMFAKDRDVKGQDLRDRGICGQKAYKSLLHPFHCACLNL